MCERIITQHTAQYCSVNQKYVHTHTSHVCMYVCMYVHSIHLLLKLGFYTDLLRLPREGTVQACSVEKNLIYNLMCACVHMKI